MTARSLLTIKLHALERVLAQRQEILAALQPIPAEVRAGACRARALGHLPACIPWLAACARPAAQPVCHGRPSPLPAVALGAPLPFLQVVRTWAPPEGDEIQAEAAERTARAGIMGAGVSLFGVDNELGMSGRGSEGGGLKAGSG